MRTIRSILSVFSPGCNGMYMQARGLKVYPIPPDYSKKAVFMPPRTKLPVMPRNPIYPPTIRLFKMQKKLKLMRGYEEHHTELMHQQFGIIATQGGRLRYENFEMVRSFFLKHLNRDTMFAIWRVDPPWQPVTKKSRGKCLGGGKGAIDHYVTPVKAGRVILEVGGECEYEDVQRCLENVASRLPFKAKAVSHEMLQEMKIEEERLEKENLHPFTWKYIIQNNMGGCHNWVKSYIHKQYFNKYV